MLKKHLVKPIKTVIVNLNDSVQETTGLLKQSGSLRSGDGLASGVLALSLAFLCLLGVVAFHFPQYLTTPELRHKYSPDIIRHIMFAALVLSGAISLLNVMFKHSRSLNAVAGGLVLICLVLGGSHVPVADFPDNTPYIGLDWVILDLLGSTLIFVLIEKLFPLAEIVTPNLPEAERIARMKIENEADIEKAARIMQSFGAGNVLIKGGHFFEGERRKAKGESESVGQKRTARDFLFTGDQLRIYEAEFIETTATHGTGCTLSAAAAANLALGKTLPEAVEISKRYVTETIRTAPLLGGGHSPVNHLLKNFK